MFCGQGLPDAKPRLSEKPLRSRRGGVTVELEAPSLSHHYWQEPGGRRVAIVTHPDGSWARADGLDHNAPVVHQSGPRRLWDEIDRVRGIWLEQGQAPFLGANCMILEDGTVKVRRGTYRATIA